MPVGTVTIPTRHSVDGDTAAKAAEFAQALMATPNKWVADSDLEFEPATGENKKGTPYDENHNAATAAALMRSLVGGRGDGPPEHEIRTRNWRLDNGKWAYALLYEPGRQKSTRNGGKKK